MGIRDKVVSAFECRGFAATIPHTAESRRARLLAWILIFLFLFSTVTLVVIRTFDPHHDDAVSGYTFLIAGLLTVFILAYILNCWGHYYASASLLVGSVTITPWISLLIDPSILQGDILPLTYVTFAVLLSSILLPIHITFPLALFQFAGVGLVLYTSPADASLNWFSFLAYIFLTSVFSILSNSIIQYDVKHMAEQAHQLGLNESLLREQSTHDYLTNLFNRRYLEETLERDILRATRNQTPVGIIILDVDDFKQINDTLGHDTGDTVLRELGKFLSSQVRQSDIACRYGGDEFVLILPDTSLHTTVERAEQLREGAKHLNLPSAITISMGVAGFPVHGTDPRILLKAADNALFRAKHLGGDHVR